MNPYLFMREHLRITQEAVAKRGGVTAQYIRRLEHGTVSNFSAAVAKAYLEYASEHANPNAFVGACVQAAQVNIKTQVTTENFERFVEFWWNTWIKRSRQAVSYSSLVTCNSIYSLCRLLVLHPYVVQYYAKHRPEKEMPADIVEALSDAGVSHTTFEETLTRLVGKK